MDKPVQKTITDDLDALLGIFPPYIKSPLMKQEDLRKTTRSAFP
jgi:hypothetical protein